MYILNGVPVDSCDIKSKLQDIKNRLVLMSNETNKKMSKKKKPWPLFCLSRNWINFDEGVEAAVHTCLILMSNECVCRSVVVCSCEEYKKLWLGENLAIRRALKGVKSRESFRPIKDKRALDILTKSGCPYFHHVDMEPYPTPLEIRCIFPNSYNFWIEQNHMLTPNWFWYRVANKLVEKKCDSTAYISTMFQRDMSKSPILFEKQAKKANK